MMFSEQAVKTFMACRFCPMCRHVCPIGLTTGNEGNTPRGKGLLLNYVHTGMEFTAEMAQDMYECCLCHNCASECETGFSPPLFIREARTQAVVQDLAPPAVRALLDNLEATDNIFGLTAENVSPDLREAVGTLPETAPTLLYLGATARFKTPDIALAVIRLLQKAGVEFTVLADEPSSGAEPGDLMGFVEDVRQVAQKCAAAITASGAATLVVLDAHSARMFKQQYAEWGIALPAAVVTATDYVAGLLRDGRLSAKAAGVAATFQDDSALSRELDETETPREIIAAMGIDLKEMFLNRKRVKSGGTVLLMEYAPRLGQLAGEGRWLDAQRAGVPVLLTSTPDSFVVMRETQPETMTTTDIFVLLEQNT
ncbi:MAG: (Fe-S)-binding protein [Methylobacteriaceae bacterium]|jgi:Fe-S oxidoreductase|nr:(Fe-S)-binding protein [Methylobacteriaceae bacterium]